MAVVPLRSPLDSEVEEAHHLLGVGPEVEPFHDLRDAL
jgi:hypothetical protein